MMQGTISELNLTGVYDRGVPNMERVSIRVNEHVDMSSFVLLQGIVGAGGGAIPIKDSMFWFGNGLLKPGDWIFVYTAAGVPQTFPASPNEDGLLVVLHWGRTQTMFHAPSVVPILARIDALLIGEPAPPTLPLTPANRPGLLGSAPKP